MLSRGCSDPLAVARKSHAPVAKGALSITAQFAPRGEIPQTNCLIETRSRQPEAIRVKRDAVDGEFVCGQFPCHPACRRIINTYSTTSIRREHLPSVMGE